MYVGGVVFPATLSINSNIDSKSWVMLLSFLEKSDIHPFGMSRLLRLLSVSCACSMILHVAPSPSVIPCAEHTVFWQCLWNGMGSSGSSPYAATTMSEIPPGLGCLVEFGTVMFIISTLFHYDMRFHIVTAIDGGLRLLPTVTVDATPESSLVLYVLVTIVYACPQSSCDDRSIHLFDGLA